MGGHLGPKKTLDRVVGQFYWPAIGSKIARYCKSCDKCQRTLPQDKKSTIRRNALNVSAILACYYWSDRTNNSNIRKGHHYVLTIVDCATRYPEAIALKRIDTETVAEAILEIFSRIGFLIEILSDQGSQFTSDSMKKISSLLSIKQFFTTLYNLKCNELCERMNGVLKGMIKKMCQEQPENRDRYLPRVIFAYREVPQASTGFSTFELLYGRTVRGPLQLFKYLWLNEKEIDEIKVTYQYILDLRNRLGETCILAQDSLKVAQGVYKHYYDKKSKEKIFKVGDKLFCCLPITINCC